MTTVLVGYAEAWDATEIYDGDVEGNGFAYYVKDDRVLAAFGMARDREMAVLNELMRRERMPSPAALRNGGVNLLERLREAGSLGRAGRRWGKGN